jgi:hypothetical protein
VLARPTLCETTRPGTPADPVRSTTVHQVKASDLVSLRKALLDEQPAVLAQIRSRMPAQLRAALDATTASAWLPDPQICDIYQHFAAVLYPHAPKPFVQLGRRMALTSYRGVYRVFLSIPSTTFVIGKAASVWASYHSTGKASMEEVTPRSAVLVVRGADRIRNEMIDIVSGHVLALAELTGAVDATVTTHVDDRSALRWSVRWK